jgi:hypothetical protein
VVGIPEWKRPLGRPKLRWKNDIQVACKGLGWKSVDCIHLTQDREHIMNFQVPLNAGNFSTSWAILAGQEGPFAVEMSVGWLVL